MYIIKPDMSKKVIFWQVYQIGQVF